MVVGLFHRSLLKAEVMVPVESLRGTRTGGWGGVSILK